VHIVGGEGRTVALEVAQRDCCGFDGRLAACLVLCGTELFSLDFEYGYGYHVED
jgi:hypothetical protein